MNENIGNQKAKWRTLTTIILFVGLFMVTESRNSLFGQTVEDEWDTKIKSWVKKYPIWAQAMSLGNSEFSQKYGVKFDMAKIKSLITAGENVDATPYEDGPPNGRFNMYQVNPLMVLCNNISKKVMRDVHETMKLLIKNKANVNWKSPNSNTCLMQAVNNTETQDLGKIKLLLENGSEINAIGATGYTALHMATIAGNSIFVRFLLKSGADKSIRDRDGKLAIEYADFAEQNYGKKTSTTSELRNLLK